MRVPGSTSRHNKGVGYLAAEKAVGRQLGQHKHKQRWLFRVVEPSHLGGNPRASSAHGPPATSQRLRKPPLSL